MGFGVGDLSLPDEAAGGSLSSSGQEREAR